MRWRRAGVDRVIFMVPAGDRETVLPLIDKYAALIDQPA